MHKIFLLLALVIISLLLFKFLTLISSSQFGKFDRFSIVALTEPVTLYSYDQINNKLTVIIFPNDLYIPEIAGGFGSYKISSVYKVGELEHKGDIILTQTISNFLGIPIDGLLKINKIFTDPKKTLLDQAVFTKSTNLNFLDKIKFFAKIMMLRFDKIKIIDLEKISSPLLMVDGSTALSLDKEVLDYNLAGIFEEPQIKKENLRLEIINTTKVIGVGAMVARQLTNIGATVVSVTTTNTNRPDCQIKSLPKNRQSISIKRISSIFTCSIIDLSEEGRFDAIIEVGTNYANKFGK